MLGVYNLLTPTESHFFHGPEGNLRLVLLGGSHAGEAHWL
jgi:hypothetical protein